MEAENKQAHELSDETVTCILRETARCPRREEGVGVVTVRGAEERPLQGGHVRAKTQSVRQELAVGRGNSEREGRTCEQAGV